MNTTKKMILGYIVGGMLVIALVPSIIYLLTLVCDTVYRFEIIRNPILRWTGILLLFAPGLLFGIWSIIIQNTVGEGGPLEIGSVEISPKTKNLVVSGPYKYTRNPMLFGAFCMYLSYALLLNSIISLLLVCALFVFMLRVVVKLEEKRLVRDFGNQYEEYRKKVTKFIPWFRKSE